MKKIYITLGIVFCLFFACACAYSQEIKPDEFEWNMRVVQDAKNASIKYCSSDMAEIYPDAEERSVSCSFADGRFVMSSGGEEVAIGSYNLESYVKADETSFYSLEFENGAKGSAVLSYVKYEDGKKEATAIVSAAEYIIYFYA
jgi:lipoprotein